MAHRGDVRAVERARVAPQVGEGERHLDAHELRALGALVHAPWRLQREEAALVLVRPLRALDHLVDEVDGDVEAAADGDELEGVQGNVEEGHKAGRDLVLEVGARGDGHARGRDAQIAPLCARGEERAHARVRGVQIKAVGKEREADDGRCGFIRQRRRVVVLRAPSGGVQKP